MEGYLLPCLVLFPILCASWVFPLGRKSPAGRDLLIRTAPAVELAAALPLSENKYRC